VGYFVGRSIMRLSKTLILWVKYKLAGGDGGVLIYVSTRFRLN